MSNERQQILLAMMLHIHDPVELLNDLKAAAQAWEDDSAQRFEKARHRKIGFFKQQMLDAYLRQAAR